MLVIIPFIEGMECQPVTEVGKIPCNITTTWNYTGSCDSHTAVVLSSSAENIINYTFSPFGTLGRCFISWNVTETGTYQGIVENGDSFSIKVGSDDNMISWTVVFFLLALNAVVFALPFFVRFSEKVYLHFLLKRMLWCLSAIMLWFNTLIIWQIEATNPLGISGPLSAYFYIFTMLMGCLVFYLAWTTVTMPMRMFKDYMQKKRMGDTD